MEKAVSLIVGGLLLIDAGVLLVPHVRSNLPDKMFLVGAASLVVGIIMLVSIAFL